MQKYPDLISEDNAMRFLSDDGGQTYNLCHFWSNFEIGDMNFWRSPAYMTFFEHLEKAGGFYYEVHILAKIDTWSLTLYPIAAVGRCSCS